MAEVESLRVAQSEMITRAKAETIAEYLSSASFHTRVEQAAEAKITEYLSSAAFQAKVEQLAETKVAEYRKSPALGKIFVTLMTFVRSAGFTEGIDCIKEKVTDFSLDTVPDLLRSNYDPDAAFQVESLIAEHDIFTSFPDPEDAGTSQPTNPREPILDRLSNSWITLPLFTF